MRRNRNSSMRGFTLVELMLAMVFLGLIIMMAATMFVQVTSMYSKGIAIKQMNQASRALTDDISRRANSVGGTFSSSGAPVRCVSIGGSVYMWSYAGETDTTPGTYKFSGGGDKFLNFVRSNTLTTCPVSSGAIDPTTVSPLLGDSLRVYEIDVRPMATPTSNLIRLKIVFGTYGGPGSANNPVKVGSKYECGIGSIGSFCAFSTYETFIYLPNEL